MKFSISRTEWGMVLGIAWIEVSAVSSFLPSFSRYERKVIKPGKRKSQPQATSQFIPKDQSSCQPIEVRSDSGTEETTAVTSWGTTDTQHLPQRIQTTFLIAGTRPNISE